MCIMEAQLSHGRVTLHNGCCSSVHSGTQGKCLMYRALTGRTTYDVGCGCLCVSVCGCVGACECLCVRGVIACVWVCGSREWFVFVQKTSYRRVLVIVSTCLGRCRHVVVVSSCCCRVVMLFSHVVLSSSCLRFVVVM